MWNPDMRSKFMRAVAGAALVMLLVATVAIQFLQRSVTPLFQILLVSSVSILSLLFCVGFLWRSQTLFSGLPMDRTNNRKAILMRQIHTITKSACILLLAIIFCRTIGVAVDWSVGSCQNLLIFQSLYRLFEFVEFASLLFLFRTHDQYAHAFCPGRAAAVHFRIDSMSSKSQTGFGADDSSAESVILQDDNDSPYDDEDDSSVLSEEGENSELSPRSPVWSRESVEVLEMSGPSREDLGTQN